MTDLSPLLFPFFKYGERSSQPQLADRTQQRWTACLHLFLSLQHLLLQARLLHLI